MYEINIALLILGFFIGYILKGFFTFRLAYNSSSTLVDQTSKQLIKLMGAIVYRVAFADYLYEKAISDTKDPEDVKIHRNELEHNFEEWKKETMETFVEYYPEGYHWQLEVNDWNSAMRALTELYKGRGK